MWPIEQAERLAKERNNLAKLPQFTFRDPAAATYVQGWQETIHSNRRYKLKIPIPPAYPHEMPSLYIIKPRRLKKHGGGTINALGVTHDFHTCENGPGGCVQICHDKPSTWDASKTLLSVFIKGSIWVELYERHLQTGRTLASLLDEMKEKLRESGRD